MSMIPVRAWVGGILLAFVTLGAFELYRYGEANGELRQKTVVVQAKAVHDSILVVRLDTVVKHDTIRLTQTLARFDTVRARFDVHDTVQVREVVAAADTAIRVCRETVSAFALSCAAKDTVITDLRGLLALRVIQPERPHWSLGVTAGYGATSTNGVLHVGPSVVAGLSWRVF